MAIQGMKGEKEADTDETGCNILLFFHLELLCMPSLKDPYFFPHIAQCQVMKQLVLFFSLGSGLCTDVATVVIIL